ncbi:cytochrome P450 [Streptomyces thinghirensis]|nr:cytochrome P450 [Streptomyces thinghirensis]
MHEEDDRLTAEEPLVRPSSFILEYENTVQLIGNAVLTLLKTPGQLANARAHPELIPGAAAELMRPVKSPAPLLLRRFPTQDITIGGLTVPAGEAAVLLSLSAANHEAWLAEPDQLQAQPRHFCSPCLGRGIHYGLGATLARVETEIALTALSERVPEHHARHAATALAVSLCRRPEQLNYRSSTAGDQ